MLWPQLPEYNICSDELNWMSIIDGMTSLKTAASFQLLASVYNPNYFSAVVVSGTGVMKHDGVNVGLINLGDETRVEGTAITDVLATATFSSEKWAAAGLTAEYVRAKGKQGYKSSKSPLILSLRAQVLQGHAELRGGR